MTKAGMQIGSYALYIPCIKMCVKFDEKIFDYTIYMDAIWQFVKSLIIFSFLFTEKIWGI